MQQQPAPCGDPPAHATKGLIFARANTTCHPGMRAWARLGAHRQMRCRTPQSHIGPTILDPKVEGLTASPSRHLAARCRGRTCRGSGSQRALSVEREIQREWEGPALEDRENGIGSSGSTRADLEPDQPAPLDGLLDPNADESSVPDKARQNAAATGASRDQERADHEGAAKAEQASKVSSSADLLDTYFRQMGHGELLSREAEIALAKRIEAAQQSVLESLCHVPLLMDRIEQWAGDLRQGRLLLADLVDISKSGDEFLGAGVGQAMLSRDDAMDEESAGDGDIAAPSDEGPEAAGSSALEESPNAARLRAMVLARLEDILAHVPEIKVLSERRIEAASLGRGLSKKSSARLQHLVSSFAAAIATLYLSADRITGLLAELEREQHLMREIEGELPRLAQRCGIARKELLARYLGQELSLHWLAEKVT